MVIYSHSRLSTFEQCKYKYKLQYIDKIKIDIPNTVEAFMGSLVHKALEKLYRDLKHQKQTSLPELLAFYNAAWQKEWTDDILIVKKEYGADNYRQMGEQYLSVYFRHYAPFDDMIVLGLETQDRLVLPDGNEYHVRIDRLGCVGDTYFVCDYKTNSALKTQDEANDDRQLAMYAVWVHQTFPDAKRVVLKWHMLAFDKEVTSERTQEQLRSLQLETASRIRALEACAEFPTSVTKLCDYCVYKSICPAWKHESDLNVKTKQVFSDEDGGKLVDEYVALQTQANRIEEELDALKAKLVAFARANGISSVFGSTKKANIKQYDAYVFPPKAERGCVDDLIRRHKLWENLSQLDTHKLITALKEHTLPPELAMELAAFVKKRELFRVSLVRR